jgi:hypothetical protein
MEVAFSYPVDEIGVTRTLRILPGTERSGDESGMASELHEMLYRFSALLLTGFIT